MNVVDKKTGDIIEIVEEAETHKVYNIITTHVHSNLAPKKKSKKNTLLNSTGIKADSEFDILFDYCISQDPSLKCGLDIHKRVHRVISDSSEAVNFFIKIRKIKEMFIRHSYKENFDRQKKEKLIKIIEGIYKQFPFSTALELSDSDMSFVRG